MSCFEKHRKVLVPGIPLLAGLTLALCILLVVMRRNRRTRRELEGQKAVLDTFFALAPIGVAISGQGGGMAFLNQEFTRITGYGVADLDTIEKWFTTLYPDPAYREEVLRLWADDSRAPQAARRIRIRCKDGRDITVDFRSAQVSTEVFVLTMADISEQIRGEEQVRHSLQEKEVLLKEIHHRVKNNLQILSSLLNMQLAALPPGTAADALRESRQRVFAMALIHEELYSSGEFAGIDLSRYLPRLLDQIFAAIPAGLFIDHSTHIQPVLLPLDQAIPCGLIINEAVTNAVKHGAGNKEGVHVAIDVREEEGIISFSVHDDGPGFPDGFDPEAQQTLGMQLLRALTRQLDGILEWKNNGGACLCIRFPRR